MTCLLKASEDLSQSFSGAEERAHKVPQLTEGVVKGNCNKLDVLVGGGGVGRRDNLWGYGEMVKGSIGTVKAKFRLEQGGGAVSWEKPFARFRGDVDLVDSLFSRDKNLKKDFAVRGFFFGLKNLLTGEVPVGKERMRVAWGEEESLSSVSFG
jgi:hypothetical protein